MNFPHIIENTIYFLALINPPSKILLLSSKKPPFSRKELFSIAARSTFAALIILLILTVAGNFILTNIFQVEIYSLSIAGGIILFFVGLSAVKQGKFYEEKDAQKIADMSIVPLAAPLIAGPGTMTAAISFASMHGTLITLICITLALGINMAFMLMSAQIGKFLEKTNTTGPLIRITGLIVTAVAMQMILNGCGNWLDKIID